MTNSNIIVYTSTIYQIYIEEKIIYWNLPWHLAGG